MIKKEFVPYQESVELKEIGFNEPCFGYRDGENYLMIQSIPHCVISAPTFSQAFRWFREKYDIQSWLNDGGYLGKVFVKITGFKHDKFYFSSSEPMEYEEAELACLRKLIEIVKNLKKDLAS